MAKESVGVAWIKTLKDGTTIIDVKMNDGVKYTMWPNKYKQAGDAKPDYNIVVNDYTPKAG